MMLIAADRVRVELERRGWCMTGYPEYMYEINKLRHDFSAAPWADYLFLDQTLRCENHYNSVPWNVLIFRRDVYVYMALHGGATGTAALKSPSLISDKPKKEKEKEKIPFVYEAEGWVCDRAKHCGSWFNLGRCGRKDCIYAVSHRCFVLNCPDPTSHGTVGHAAFMATQ